MMQYKKWALWLIVLTLVTLVLFAAAMFFIDPLMMFRDGSKTFSSFVYNQLYSAPGVARHMDYDSVVTGSCMVGQFDVNEVNELFGTDALKLTFNGATEKNIRTILDICYEKNPDLKTVFLSLDSFGAIDPADQTGYPLPEYMYELSPSSYATYLLNLDVFYHFGLKNVLGSLRGRKSGPTEIGPDHADGTYGARYVLGTGKPLDPDSVVQTDTSMYAVNTQDNLRENLLPIIEAHPETEFVFYLPPYSILYWEKQKAIGTLQPMVESMREVVGACLKYDNVRIYSFMWDQEYILDLDNYRDIMHFSSEVASRVLEGIGQERGRLTQENYSEQLDGFLDFVESFDFDAFYAQQVASLQG